MQTELKMLCALCPRLADYMTQAFALLEAPGTDSRVEALARLARLAKEALPDSPFAAAMLLRIVRDAAGELAGKAFEIGGSRDAAGLAATLDSTSTAKTPRTTRGR